MDYYNTRYTIYIVRNTDKNQYVHISHVTCVATIQNCCCIFSLSNFETIGSLIVSILVAITKYYTKSEQKVSNLPLASEKN